MINIYDAPTVVVPRIDRSQGTTHEKLSLPFFNHYPSQLYSLAPLKDKDMIRYACMLYRNKYKAWPRYVYVDPATFARVGDGLGHVKSSEALWPHQIFCQGGYLHGK